MLRSMTAYGRSTLKTSHAEFVCEVRSVNHRYLDFTVRLPDELRAAESDIRSRLAECLQRGKVEAVLKYSHSGSEKNALAIDENLLKQLGDAVDKVASVTGKNAVTDAVQLLQWPGVVGISEAFKSELVEDALAVFERALHDFVATREREGDSISQLLLIKSMQLKGCVADVRNLRPKVLQRQREKWLVKLNSLKTEHDGARLEQELVYAAQKLDVDEELDRLDAHIIELGRVLERDESVGRRLDFLMQEFNREVNTLSSKSSDIATTNVSVDMKVLIEQMREQVQNVE